MKTVALLLLLSVPAAAAERGGIQLPPGEIAWKDAPASMPAGARIAVLEGDPKQAGLFTIRLKVPRGSEIAPHTHPREERVTVLSGRVAVGFGEAFDPARLRAFPAGSYYVNPPDVPHFLRVLRDSELQVTGLGPWEVDFLSPTEKP